MTVASLMSAMQNSVAAQLAQVQINRVVLGLSGGLDSMLLLSLLQHWQQQQPERELLAVYVHHGLSPAANDWLSFCQQQCEQRQIPFQACHVKIQSSSNIEEQARTVRYQALTAYVKNDRTALCTAHHADDQFETILLALKRGSGLAGLAGIAALKSWQAGWLCRPLLAFNRAELAAVASEAQLRWIEDESNQDRRFDRNFLRLEVIPLLTERWPSLAKTASRSMQQLAQVHQAQQLLLTPLLADMSEGTRLRIPALLQQAEALQPLLIRQWLAQFELNPSSERLLAIQQQLITAKVDATPRIAIAGWELRRYQHEIHLLTPQQVQHFAQVPQPQQIQANTVFVLPDGRQACWDSQPQPWGKDAYYLPLAVELSNSLNLSYPALSMKFQPSQSNLRRSLQNWYKEWQIPPWVRPHVPVLICDEQILAVLDYASSTDAVRARSWLSIALRENPRL